ncbi:MAG: sulfotransferase [Tetrasphaera sp.]
MTDSPQPAQSPQPTAVTLYVGGTGRSGSTLLAGALGGAPGAVDVGEVRFLWERGLMEQRLCGCGQPVPQCPFWTEVLNRAFGTERPDSARLHAALTRATRLRRLPSWLARRPPPVALARTLRSLYAAIAEVAGADVVIDSSKLPTYAALLAALGRPEVRLVHVVRDPRASAFSWASAKAAPDAREGLMEQRGVVKSALLWLVWNLALEALWRGRGRYLRVRYEDLAAAPADVLAAVAAHAGLPAKPPLATGQRLTLPPNHTVAGNPSRLRPGPTWVRRDDRWLTGLAPKQRRLVTALTAPALRRYGYPVRWGGR